MSELPEPTWEEIDVLWERSIVIRHALRMTQSGLERLEMRMDNAEREKKPVRPWP